MKLNEKGTNALREVLSGQNQGPFSKNENAMLALELMEKGQELSSNQITKVHLSNIIKAICIHMEWTEEITEQENDTIIQNEKIEEEENSPTNVDTQVKNSEKNMQVFQSG